MNYSNHAGLGQRIDGYIRRILKGETIIALTVMIKKSLTEVLAPGGDLGQKRFQVGNKLTTYVEVTPEGELIKETWGGGVATIEGDSVILRNEKPILYPEGHYLAGKEVQGWYQEDGQFVCIDGSRQQSDYLYNHPQKIETLYNEYVSDTKTVMESYGATPTSEWVGYRKLNRCFAFTLEGYGPVEIITKKGVKINITDGDSVVIETRIKTGEIQIVSVRGVRKEWMDRTYAIHPDFE